MFGSSRSHLSLESSQGLCLLHIMPTVVEVAYNVSFNGSAPWRVPSGLIQLVDQLPFVRLRAWDGAFVRLVIHHLLELPKGQSYSRPSLASCEGFKALRKLLNDAVAVAAQCATAEPQEKSLFGESATSCKTKKAPVMKASQLNELRATPTTCEFLVPGSDGRPALSIMAIKPVHPCDDLQICLDADSLDHCIMYIRSFGISLEQLFTKRQYASLSPGLWLNGSAGKVRKIIVDADDEPEGCDEETLQAFKKRRFVSCNRGGSGAMIQANLCFTPIQGDTHPADTKRSPTAYAQDGPESPVKSLFAMG